MSNLEQVLRKELDSRLSHLVGERIEDAFEEYNQIVNKFKEEMYETMEHMTEQGYRMTPIRAEE